MKKGVMISLLLGAGLRFWQIPDTDRTQEMFNGRYWESLPHSQKTFAVLTYEDACYAYANAFLASPKRAANMLYEYFPNSGTIGDMVKALDRIYAEPENLRLPIVYALRIVAMKFASDKPEDIEAELRRLRIVATKQ